MTTTITLSADECGRRHLKRTDYVPCTDAFIDCRIPGSMPKENFSMIGPGVTQNPSQVINLREPHGFNIGAAGMHPGITNNLHLHFTSEVFINTAGRYLLRWGAKGDEGELILEPGDIACMPTWIFRGFSALSNEYGFLMTVLGGDDTGGIIWSPEVLKRAQATGMWLSKENTVIDVGDSGETPAAQDVMPLMPESELATLKRWSVDEMRARVVGKSARDFKPATLDCAAGMQWEIAPVIGYGLSQFRGHVSAVNEALGFSVEWMRVPVGGGSATFTLAEKMVVICQRGTLDIKINSAPQVYTTTLSEWDMFSIPAHAVRSFANRGNMPCEAVIVIAGDARKRAVFDAATIAAALQNDCALDASGLMARASILPPAMLS
jgi:quercetin dioxygenase-like cupin family protein